MGLPATPERVRTLLKSQFSEEAREKRWLVCEHTVCEPSPYGSPTPWKSSLPPVQSPPQGSQVSEEIHGCNSMGCVISSKKAKVPDGEWRVSEAGRSQAPSSA